LPSRELLVSGAHLLLLLLRLDIVVDLTSHWVIDLIHPTARSLHGCASWGTNIHSHPRANRRGIKLLRLEL